MEVQAVHPKRTARRSGNRNYVWTLTLSCKPWSGNGRMRCGAEFRASAFAHTVSRRVPRFAALVPLVVHSSKQRSVPMPPITALLHTSNDALRLGRALETLLPCAELLIVDHGSTDATLRVARAYGARLLGADGLAAAKHYLERAASDWIFCLDPSES